MKRILMVMLILMFGAAGTALAVDQTFTVSIEIRQAIAISKISDLVFGIVEQPTVATTYTVQANAAGPHSAGVGAGSASFTVTGDTSSSATVSAAMTTPVGTTTNEPSLTVSSATISLATPATVYVGGSWLIDPSDTAGTHSGTGTLTVLYQ